MLRGWLFPVIVFCWPFLFHIDLILPFNGSYFTIGNDFDFLYYDYKLYLLSALNSGHFPWWSPSEGAGFPFYSSPFAQAFYPFNLPLLLWYKLFGGYTALDHQRFTILGVAIFALGLYLWLSQTRLNRRAVLFACLLMPICFKFADILRLPNAVHTAAWLPWVLYCVTRLVHEPSTRKAFLTAGLLFFVLICLFTAGYLYYVYYSALLFTPYFVILLVPKLRSAFIGEKPVYLKRALSLLAVSGLLATAIAAPYYVKMLGLLRQTTDRGGGDFDYATGPPFGVFTITDSIGSLIFPPASSTEGWVYFSILGVLLVVLYLFSRGEDKYFSPLVKIGFLLWIAVIVWITYGRESILFRFLWDYAPGFSSLRVWARLNIILVPILAWMLAISYQHYESLVSHTLPRKWKPLAVLAGTALVILLVQLYFYTNHAYDEYWLQWHEGSANELAFIVFTPIALIVTMLFVVGARPRKSTTLIFILFVGIAAVDLKGGNLAYWVWRDGLAPVEPRVTYNIPVNNLRSFDTPRIDPPLQHFTINPTERFSVSVIPNWFFVRYNTFLDNTTEELEARHEFLGVTSTGKLYFTEQLDYPSIAAFLDARQSFEYEVVSYTGDELILNVDVPAVGYLSFIDNWDADWTAQVDGASVPIDLLFGTFKSVHLSEGEHSVTFAYRPSLFAGN